MELELFLFRLIKMMVRKDLLRFFFFFLFLGISKTDIEMSLLKTAG